MGLLAPVLAAGFGPALNDGYWTGGARWGDDVPQITPDAAMAIPAFYAGVAVIAEDMGKTTTHIYEDLGEAGRRHPTNMPLEELLQYQPNPHQTAFDFKEMMTAWSILRKFAIAEIIPGPRGPVDQIVPLHPDLVREEADSVGKRYIYRDPKQKEPRTLRSDQVFVLRGRLGRSVLDYASQSLSVDAAIERYAGTLFARGARPQAVVKHPAELSENGRKNLRNVLDEYSIAGPRSGRPLLLEEGLDWQEVSLTNKDAEFMENRRWGVRQVCRHLRLPPHKLADLSDANYSNVEQENINYVTDTLLSWAVRWELTIRRDLIVAKDRFFAKFALDILLRGDILGRFQAYALAVQWGWLTRNEVRALEERNPLPGLDGPLTPLNMTSTGTATTAEAGELDPAARGYLRLLAADAAERVVRGERTAIAKAADHAKGNAAAFAHDLEAFYAGHAKNVSLFLHIPMDAAMSYAAAQRAEVAAGAAPDDEWAAGSITRLTSLVAAQLAA